MVKLASLFAVERGSSHGGSDYRAGEVAFITSTEKRNGVAAFVNPLDGDRVFDGPLVTVSALGHATLQQGRFLPKSNGGDAVVVLRPSKPVDRRWLVAFCAYFNLAHKWRFGFGRKAAGRLGALDIDVLAIERALTRSTPVDKTSSKLQGTEVRAVIARLKAEFGPHPTVADVFEVQHGEGALPESLESVGEIPVVSCSETKVNAVVGYVGRQSYDPLPEGTIAVAKNGKPCVSRVQPGAYYATGDVACLVAKGTWTTRDLCVLAALVERNAWRFSYGRKAGERRLAELELL